MTTTRLPQRTVYLGTSGVLNDRDEVASLRDARVVPSPESTPETLILDIDGAIHTPMSLQTLLLPIAKRIRSGDFGCTAVVIRTSNEGNADFVSYLARAHDLPLFLFGPNDFKADIPQPLGDLTYTDVTSMNTLYRLGGHVTVSRFANELGIEPSAAHNRLAGLAKRKYLFRFTRGRREGDLFVDPRAAR